MIYVVLALTWIRVVNLWRKLFKLHNYHMRDF